MSYAANVSPDFKSIAQDLAASLGKNASSSELEGSVLIPAEAYSRMQREGSRFLRSPALNGATVDQEGLTNNYAVEPEMYYAVFPSPEQARQYAFQGLAAVTLIASLVMTSLVIS